MCPEEPGGTNVPHRGADLGCGLHSWFAVGVLKTGPDMPPFSGSCLTISSKSILWFPCVHCQPAWGPHADREENEGEVLCPFILLGCGQHLTFLEGFNPHTLIQNIFPLIAALSHRAQACIDGAHNYIWGISNVTFSRGSCLCP